MEKDPALATHGAGTGPKTKTRRTWWGGKRTVVVEDGSATSSLTDVEAGPEQRRPMLLAPIYNGLAAALSICESGADLVPVTRLLMRGCSLHRQQKERERRALARKVFADPIVVAHQLPSGHECLTFSNSAGGVLRS